MALAISRILAANSLEDNRQALSEIQALRAQLREIDREAARMEEDLDSEEFDDDKYNDLDEQARTLFKAIDTIAEEYELSGDYMSVDEFSSNCVANAGFNY